MGLPLWVGYVAFAGVPFALWLFGTTTIRRSGIKARALAFVAGSDNRLSLSRAQAFLWTLVIFGSYAAAMAIHNPIIPGTPVESEQAGTEAKKTTDRATAAVVDLEKTAGDTRTAVENKKKAEVALREAEVKLSKASDASADEKKNLDVIVAQAKRELAAKTDTVAFEEKRAEEAKTLVATTRKQADDATKRAKSFSWVIIPGELLALAGIAIGSGVFASLIAAVTTDTQSVRVTGIHGTDIDGLLTDLNKQLTGRASMTILGQNLTKTSVVSLDGKAVPILFWKPDGTEITVDVPSQKEYGTVIVDTPDVKLSYSVTGKTPFLKLGGPTYFYEMNDFFRDDRNPRAFDLMKFQMFGWTIVGVTIYSTLFLEALSSQIDSLPMVPQSIVLLTGLSQAGYLAGKGVSATKDTKAT